MHIHFTYVPCVVYYLFIVVLYTGLSLNPGLRYLLKLRNIRTDERYWYIPGLHIAYLRSVKEALLRITEFESGTWQFERNPRQIRQEDTVHLFEGLSAVDRTSVLLACIEYSSSYYCTQLITFNCLTTCPDFDYKHLLLWLLCDTADWNSYRRMIVQGGNNISFCYSYLFKDTVSSLDYTASNYSIINEQ